MTTEPEREKCVWRRVRDCSYWYFEPECGTGEKVHSFAVDGPFENGLTECPDCGKPIEIGTGVRRIEVRDE